jgi:hypothetical protein
VHISANGKLPAQLAACCRCSPRASSRAPRRPLEAEADQALDTLAELLARDLDAKLAEV